MTGSRQKAKALLEEALNTFTNKDNFEAHSQLVAVPIDEKIALSVRVSPTYSQDEINSVTLKSFRKVVGFDTFEAIRIKDRAEKKDPADYYNVTVSMMVKRKPAEGSGSLTKNKGNTNLGALLDKGFPYDD